MGFVGGILGRSRGKEEERFAVGIEEGRLRSGILAEASAKSPLVAVSSDSDATKCKSAPSVVVLSLPSRGGVPIYAPTAVNYCKCRL